MGKEKGNKLAYAFYTVLYVAPDRKRFKLGDTAPERFLVCKSTAYRILKELCQQELLEPDSKLTMTLPPSSIYDSHCF